jgi:hypothetical protein
VKGGENVMKRHKLIPLCIVFLLFIGFAGWAAHVSGQQKVDEGVVQKESERYMPLLKGDYWQKMSANSKVSFIWGVAHVVLIEAVLMEQAPELKRESFVTKVVEARAARTAAGTRLTINQIIDIIDQYYKDHPDKLEVPVMKVIWDLMIKPNIKTGIAGRPLK